MTFADLVGGESIFLDANPLVSVMRRLAVMDTHRPALLFCQ